MPVISRLVSMGLRTGEFVFACVVTGLVAKYLHDYDNSHSDWPQARFIYTIVISCISILLSLLWLLPFAGGFIHWPTDLILSAAWFASFGLLVSSLHNANCGSAFHWGGIVRTHGSFCSKLRATEAFSFLSAVFWLVSTLVGIWFMHRTRRDRAAAVETTTTRRKWYRRSHV